MDTIEVLCIGGNHDGERIKTRERRYINLIDKRPLRPFNPNVDTTATIKYSGYIIEEFRAGIRSFWVGRPPDYSIEETTELLFKGYKNGLHR